MCTANLAIEPFSQFHTSVVIFHTNAFPRYHKLMEEKNYNVRLAAHIDISSKMRNAPH